MWASDIISLFRLTNIKVHELVVHVECVASKALWLISKETVV